MTNLSEVNIDVILDWEDVSRRVSVGTHRQGHEIETTKFTYDFSLYVYVVANREEGDHWRTSIHDVQNEIKEVSNLKVYDLEGSVVVLEGSDYTNLCHELENKVSYE